MIDVSVYRNKLDAIRENGFESHVMDFIILKTFNAFNSIHRIFDICYLKSY